MKKYGLVFAAVMVIIFSLSFPSALLAEEGHMHGMKGHNMKGMEKSAETLVTDPVCGMRMNPDEAGAKTEYQGKTYYFCQDSDRETFEKDPEKYLHKHEEGKQDEEMHKGHPGSHHEMEMERHEDEGHEHHHMMGGAHWEAPVAEAGKKNPVKASAESITRGGSIFKARCVICHGENGDGNGALAATLDPKPADLTSKMLRMHPDGDLFYKISKGKGAMPAWESTISEKDRWNLVNYIRSLGKKKTREN